MNEVEIAEPQIIAGVHNDRYNLDYYEDGAIVVFDTKDQIEITEFDPETVHVLLKHIKKAKPNLF